MSFFRRTMIAAAAIAGVASALASGTADARRVAPAYAGPPPYCVLVGGARGMPLPQICRFFGYQQCLQAAADLHGNCVANIDYRGPPPDTTGATWARGAR
jgi:hypothetical protein